MVGPKDVAFRALAARLMGKYRTTTSTLARTSGGYNPVTGSTTGSTSSADVFRSPAFPFDQGQVDGEAVLATDYRCYVAASDVETAGVSPVPSTDVTVTLDGDRVLSARKLESGDQAAAYELHVRAG